MSCRNVDVGAPCLFHAPVGSFITSLDPVPSMPLHKNSKNFCVMLRVKFGLPPRMDISCADVTFDVCKSRYDRLHTAHGTALLLRIPGYSRSLA